MPREWLTVAERAEADRNERRLQIEAWSIGLLWAIGILAAIKAALF